jgi:hypothetical protein
MWEVTPSSFGKTRDWQKFFSELTLEKDLGYLHLGLKFLR